MDIKHTPSETSLVSLHANRLSIATRTLALRVSFRVMRHRHTQTSRQSFVMSLVFVRVLKMTHGHSDYKIIVNGSGYFICCSEQKLYKWHSVDIKCVLTVKLIDRITNYENYWISNWPAVQTVRKNSDFCANSNSLPRIPSIGDNLKWFFSLTAWKTMWKYTSVSIQ